MANPVELYNGTTRMFRFDPMPQNITFDLQKTGNSPMDIPTYIRPWMFDFSSQARNVTINVTLMSLSAYDSSIPGTGTILDQIEDLTYIMSGNWVTDIPLELFVPYPQPINVSRDLSGYYNSNGNTDYELDLASLPSGVYPSGSGITRNRSDKIYYVYPQSFNVVRDEASVNRVKVTLTFQEANSILKI
jgi:hypothetical protein